MSYNDDPGYETGVWANLKNGLQVGAGFFVGYYFMRFLSILAMIVTAVVVGMFVCVPHCDEIDREVIAPIENKVGTQIINPPTAVWPSGCLVRSKPTTKSRVIGQVDPSRQYIILDTKRGWIKIGGIRVRGWVGCKPGASLLKSKKYMKI